MESTLQSNIHGATRGYSKMKRTLTAVTVAATMFASSASAFDPDDLQILRNTGDCRNCDLKGADLRNTSLNSADLEGANLRGADLEGANLRGADLGAANLEGADLAFTQMNGAILCNTTMPDGSVIYSGC